MTDHRCLVAAGLGGLALAAVLLQPRVVAAGARAGAALLDWLSEHAVEVR